MSWLRRRGHLPRSRSFLSSAGTPVGRCTFGMNRNSMRSEQSQNYPSTSSFQCLPVAHAEGHPDSLGGLSGMRRVREEVLTQLLADVVTAVQISDEQADVIDRILRESQAD